MELSVREPSVRGQAQARSRLAGFHGAKPTEGSLPVSRAAADGVATGNSLVRVRSCGAVGHAFAFRLALAFTGTTSGQLRVLRRVRDGLRPRLATPCGPGPTGCRLGRGFNARSASRALFARMPLA